MNSEHLLYLLERFRDHTISNTEQHELDDWYQSLDAFEKSFEEWITEHPEVEEAAILEFRNQYLQAPKPALVRTMKRWKWIAAAAAVIVLLVSATYFISLSTAAPKLTAGDSREKRFMNDVEPGKHKALLTLANGKKVVLDQTNGIIAENDHIDILNQGGELRYGTGNSPVDGLTYNTVATARGESYSIRLSDDTKVWLNSGSSIRFPALFPSNGRSVTITGEAYFEVAKDASRPFRVRRPNDDFETEVLGTQFNIKAYDDEDALRVTLLEGSVRVHKNNKEVLLIPGQQAQLTGTSVKVKDGIDMEQVMAWKNGLFYFRNTSIQEIMREAARWYDVDIEYQGKPSTDGFNGRLTRDTKLSELLKVLELNDVRFIVEGRKIRVVN
jgi:transmembrane sensor